MSSIGRGFIGSVIGGAIGAAIWTLISYFTHLESGWIAWGVGFLAGIGMACAGGRGVSAGLLASVVAIGAIVGGKYATVHMEVNDHVHSIGEFTAADAKSYMAGELMDEYVRQGRTMEYDDDGNYPAEVWDDTNAQWAAMSPTERHQYTLDTRAKVSREIEESKTTLEAVGMIASLGLFDVLWVLLAVSTAYKLGSAARKSDREIHTARMERGEAVERGPLDRYAPATGRATPAASAPAAQPALAQPAAQQTPAKPAKPAEPPPSEQFRIPGAPPLTGESSIPRRADSGEGNAKAA